MQLSTTTKIEKPAGQVMPKASVLLGGIAVLGSTVVKNTASLSSHPSSRIGGITDE